MASKLHMIWGNQLYIHTLEIEGHYETDVELLHKSTYRFNKIRVSFIFPNSKCGSWQHTSIFTWKDIDTDKNKQVGCRSELDMSDLTNTIYASVQLFIFTHCYTDLWIARFLWINLNFYLKQCQSTLPLDKNKLSHTVHH